jgi:hypothetical protein
MALFVLAMLLLLFFSPAIWEWYAHPEDFRDPDPDQTEDPSVLEDGLADEPPRQAVKSMTDEDMVRRREKAAPLLGCLGFFMVAFAVGIAIMVVNEISGKDLTWIFALIVLAVYLILKFSGGPGGGDDDGMGMAASFQWHHRD